MILRSDGASCAVCSLPDGRFAFVWAEGYGALVCEVEGVLQWRVDRPAGIQGWGLDVDCAADSQGRVWAVCKAFGTRDEAYLIEPGQVPRSLGPCYAQRAQRIAWDGSQMVVFVVDSGFTFTRNGVRSPIPFTAGTSQGILAFRADLTPVWYDSRQYVDVAGVRLASPRVAGPYTVGQSLRSVTPDKSIRIDGYDGGALFTALAGLGDCYDPSIALSHGRLAIAARTARGSALVVGPPFAPYAVPVPVPTPPPPPIPVPEPPMPDPTLTHLLRDQTAVIAGVKRDYPQLGAAGIVDQSIHRLNQSNGTDRYGRKARRSDGTNPNDDAITIRLDDHDYSKKKLIDVLIASGEANTPTWDVRPASEEPGNGYWRPAVAPDLDGETPEPPDPSDPPQPPPGAGIPSMSDSEVIDLSERWIVRYTAVGRYQRQMAYENLRDQAYWVIVYCRAREQGRSHEAALRAMERGMNAEAGLPDPYSTLP